MGKAEDLIARLTQPRGKYPTPWGQPPVPVHKVCPMCGRTKVARWNTRIGKWFFGCTGYPSCRWSANIKYRWSMQFFEDNPDYPTWPREVYARELEKAAREKRAAEIRAKKVIPPCFESGEYEEEEEY